MKPLVRTRLSAKIMLSAKAKRARASTDALQRQCRTFNGSESRLVRPHAKRTHAGVIPGHGNQATARSRKDRPLRRYAAMAGIFVSRGLDSKVRQKVVRSLEVTKCPIHAVAGRGRAPILCGYGSRFFPVSGCLRRARQPNSWARDASKFDAIAELYEKGKEMPVIWRHGVFYLVFPAIPPSRRTFAGLSRPFDGC